MLTSQLDHQARTLTDDQLASGGGDMLVLNAGDNWKDVEADVSNAVQIDIQFDSFKDGRGFTLASQLRERLGYAGRLRATGDLIPDQAGFLKRVGFDAVAPDRGDLAADWARAEAQFSDTYQPATDRSATIVNLRRKAGADLTRLNARYREQDALEILRDAIENTWKGRIAIMSSFGAEAAIGLHLVSRVAPDTPVLFLDTGRLFAQTEQYQRELSDKLGLTNIRIIRPSETDISAEDADGKLWSRDADACCTLRKVRPLDKILGEYDALITGRKRFHGGDRLSLPLVERINDRIRVNPLANWSAGEIQAYFKRYDLPRHPLTEMGYASIGCWTCTAPASDDDVRSGRWAGQDKSECGIHRPTPALEPVAAE